MNANDPLTEAIGEWQRKNHIADSDPMIAALELVRVYLHNSRKIDETTDAAPPRLEDFRSTIELLASMWHEEEHKKGGVCVGFSTVVFYGQRNFASKSFNSAQRRVNQVPSGQL